MIELLRSIVDSITTVFSLLIHTIESLIIFIANIPRYLQFFIDSFDLLPAVIVPFAIASIYIYIMYFIIARE